MPKDIKPNSPYCIRLTDEERAKLSNAASGVHLSKYIKSVLFNRDLPQVNRRNTTPVKDHKQLAKLLALIGQSRVASNINQLAKAANSGSLPVNQDVLHALNEAVQHIRNIRNLLMQALGIKPKGNDDE